MMVYFWKVIPKSIVNDWIERIVRHGLNVISSRSNDHDDDSSIEVELHAHSINRLHPTRYC